MHKILHPTDFSPTSTRLFQMVCAIARDQGAEIVVLHVIPEDHADAEGTEFGQIGETSPVYRNAEAHYRELASSAEGLCLSFHVEAGPLVKVIADFARKTQCDLIALASFRHSYVDRQYHGCVAESLVQVAPCPVLCLQSPCDHAHDVGDREVSAVDSNVRGDASDFGRCVERQW